MSQVIWSSARSPTCCRSPPGHHLYDLAAQEKLAQASWHPATSRRLRDVLPGAPALEASPAARVAGAKQETTWPAHSTGQYRHSAGISAGLSPAPVRHLICDLKPRTLPSSVRQSTRRGGIAGQAQYEPGDGQDGRYSPASQDELQRDGSRAFSGLRRSTGRRREGRTARRQVLSFPPSIGRAEYPQVSG